MTFRLRPPTEADLELLLELAREHALATGRDHTLTAQGIRDEWDAPHQDRERFNRVAEVDGTVVGTANVWNDRTMVYLGGYVTPSHRRQGIGSALYAWALETIDTMPGIGYIQCGHQVPDPDGERFVSTREGFTYQRSFMRMRHDEPHTVEKPSFGGGLELVVPDDPVAEMVRLRNASFEDHWGNVPWVAEDLARSIETGENDPSLWFFAAVDGEPAGVCRNQLFTDDQGLQRAYLGPIGTLRAFRGRGVARQLLRHSVAELVARNAASVTLWVDSENPFEATKLYASNGFTTRGEWRVFRRYR